MQPTATTHCPINNPNACHSNTIVDRVGKKLDTHPTLHKVIVVVAHIFRMLSMLALICFLPFSFALNCIFTLAGSIFYRVAIERNCPFRFAIPSCLGAMAIAYAAPYTAALLAKVTLGHLAKALITAVPIGLYFTYIVMASNSEVDDRQKDLAGTTPGTPKKSCCKKS